MNNVENLDKDVANKYASLISFIRSINLNKIPSLIESVEWVKYNNSKNEESVRTNLGILLKDKSDQKKYIERLEDINGNTILSREKARREEAWVLLEKSHQSDEIVTGIILGRVKYFLSIKI